MDFKLKGKSWAGNIYHQFESICQDVDDFMSKDTVKIVENHVQNVSVSVKRLYSNVVQDILPHPEDPVKSESQSVDGEHIDTKNHVHSVTDDIVTEPACIKEKHSSMDQSPDDAMKNSGAPLPIELGHGMQFTRIQHAGLSLEEESRTHSREDGDGTVPNDADNSLEENNTTKVSVLLTTESSSRRDMSSEITDEAHNNSILTVDSLPVPSAHETGISGEDHADSALNRNSSPEYSSHEAAVSTVKKEIMSFNSYSDDTVCPSDNSIDGCGFRSKFPIGYNPNLDVNRVLSPLSGTSADEVYKHMTMESLLPSSSEAPDRTLSNSDEKTSVSTPSLTSPHKVNELECVTMDSPLPSASDAVDRVSGTDGTLCDSFSTKDESFDASNSVLSFEHMLSYFSDEEERADFMENAKDFHYFHATRRGYNVSTLPEAVAFETNAVDALPAYFISESNGSIELTTTLAEDYAFRTNMSEVKIGSSECRHDQTPQSGESKFLRSSSEVGSTSEFDVGTPDLTMETIDLSSNNKHDEESIILNTTFAHSVSHRRKNFRYYKKLIRDAFTSRARLSQEYKQLAIIYGDIDKESSQDFRPSSAPSSPDEYLHASHVEPEWELL